MTQTALCAAYGHVPLKAIPGGPSPGVVLGTGLFGGGMRLQSGLSTHSWGHLGGQNSNKAQPSAAEPPQTHKTTLEVLHGGFKTLQIPLNLLYRTD